MTWPLILQVAAALLCGLLLGAVYFALLFRTAQLHTTASALQTVLPLYLLRVALAVAVLWGLAQFGTWSLLAGLSGFLCARGVAQYLVNRSSDGR